MRRDKLSHFSGFIIVCVLVLCLAGCHSSRSVSKGSVGRRPQSSAPVPKHLEGIVNGESNSLVAEARRWLGTPYRYGGMERGKGTDCSGMVMTIYSQVEGIKIPRNSAAQQQYCAPLKRSALQAGDLVFFSSGSNGGKVSHVGLYVGDDVFIHASSSRGVIASSLTEDYYKRHYHSSGRVHGYKPGKSKKKKRESEEPAPISAPEPSTLPKPIEKPEPAIAPAPEPTVEPAPAIAPAPEPIVEPEPAIAPAHEPIVEPEPAITPAQEPVQAPVSGPIPETPANPEPQTIPEASQEPESIATQVRNAMKF